MKSPNGLVRPALAPAVEGFLKFEESAEINATLNVGVITRSYSEIDFLVSQLAIRASHHPSYVGIFPRYPKEIGEREKFWFRALDVEGPLSPFASFGRKILPAYKQIADLRHIVAHSRFYYEAPGLIVFERIRPGKDIDGVKGSGKLLTSHTWVKMTPRQLTRNAKLSVRVSRVFARAYERIDRVNIFPYKGSFTVTRGGQTDQELEGQSPQEG